MIYKKIRLTKTRIAGALFALALLLQACVPLLTPGASADTLTNTLVRFDRLAQAQATTGTVCAKTTAAVATEAVAQVILPTGFTVTTASPATTWAVSTTNIGWPATAIAWVGIAAPTGAGNFTVSGQTVNFQSGDLAINTLYCFNWTNTAAVTTGTAGNYTGSVTTETAAPAAISTGNYGLTTVGVGADQITVSATVNPAFSLALSSTTDALSVLALGSVSVSPAPRTATVNTNAPNGWYLWAKDSNQGLNSTIASYTIPSVVTCSSGVSSNSTLVAGTEGYNLGAVATSQTGGTGTVSIPAVFTGGSTGRGGGLCNANNYQTIASSNGTANTSVVTVTNNAAISGITKPGTDYTDLETFVGAGLF